jgi:hypothetical protein
VRTIDGVPVEPGLIVWDYDLHRSQVAPIKGTHADPDSEWHDSWDGFYAMVDPDTGDRRSIMTGDRMWYRHPTTGKSAVSS